MSLFVSRLCRYIGRATCVAAGVALWCGPAHAMGGIVDALNLAPFVPLVLDALKQFNRESGVTVVMISSELEELRQAGREKTVQFKELLAEKLTVEAILTQLRYAGLEE